MLACPSQLTGVPCHCHCFASMTALYQPIYDAMAKQGTTCRCCLLMLCGSPAVSSLTTPDRLAPDALIVNSQAPRRSITGEVVGVYRELAPASPDSYRPAFVQSPSNLRLWLWEVGGPVEGLPPAREAITIRPEVAALAPHRYRSELANSLTSLATVMSAISRETEAVDARTASLSLRDGLSGSLPARGGEIRCRRICTARLQRSTPVSSVLNPTH
jgi:hypothetical protein